MPTRVLLDGGCVWKNRAYLAALGKKAFIVTGKKSAKENGAYDDVVRALEANGQGHALYDRVMSNPTEVCVYEAAAECRGAGCDFVVAIGGGSPMDAGKAAAILALNDIPIEKFFNKEFDKVLPIAAVPTTAGTGSETTPYAVLVDSGSADAPRFANGRPQQERAKKRSVSLYTLPGSPSTFPEVAFLDAKYMRSLGRETTVNTAVDALSHAVEGMCGNKADFMSDALARESIALILRSEAEGGCRESLVNFPDDASQVKPIIRERLLLDSTLAGMVISQTGTTAVHSVGYAFTLEWNTDRGRANGLLLGEFLKILEKKEASLPPEKRRLPAVAKALGMPLDEFSALLAHLLGRRKGETADAQTIAAWVERPETLRSGPNSYIPFDKSDAAELLRKCAG
jgi:alcohol dehydrogenase class IV